MNIRDAKVKYFGAGRSRITFQNRVYLKSRGNHISTFERNVAAWKAEKKKLEEALNLAYL